MKKVVFFGCAGGTLAIAIWALLAPANTDHVLGSMLAWISEWFEWFYVALPTACLVFVCYIAFSRYGRTRIGPDHSRPEFSTLTWASMLFAAGIGTDMMYFAVSGPATHYLAPPSSTTAPESVDAAREASVWTIFHYGISGWAIYALMGMALGYLAYRRRLPLAIRSVLYPILGKRAYGIAGDAVDLAAVLGTIFGVAASLGIGVVLINVGLNVIFGVAVGLIPQIIIVALGVAIATASAVSGVDRGIKLLAQANVILAVGLTLFILVAGKTSYLLNALVLNVADFVRLFPGMAMQTFAFEDTGTWMSSWTLFFFAWWVAWSPFVGMFLARISRGRTLREFVGGVLLLPFSYIIMWVSIYGNAAIDSIRNNGDREFADSSLNRPEEAFFDLLADYPWFPVVAVIAAVTALIFYVTSANSAALVMANLTSKVEDPDDDGAAAPRVFWAIATGLLTIAVLSVGGIGALQAATVIMGLPFAFVLVAVMYGLLRSLRDERARASSVRATLPAALLSRSETSDGKVWRARLKRAVALPTSTEADEFLYKEVADALEEVAQEVRAGGQSEAKITRSRGTSPDNGPAVTLTITGPDAASTDEPFIYSVHRENFCARADNKGRRSAESYARLEVHLGSGGQGYDIMGLTSAQLINDVLDQYERHIEFLRITAGHEIVPTPPSDPAAHPGDLQLGGADATTPPARETRHAAIH
ncbi:BCCT family transporter (plasmid) [Rhodococcus rhodochrous]|uniref:choline BCCT transporter BetT n=1 Tax=Rhodococcus rhodochrous TaxID=1829 RepID=UPI00132ED19A|nr:choline BCCT transporter BetT [Rhodococcus rhodochrous]QHG85520.1 BCCT family transporter [Rhodococcus rhodochrous]